MTISVLGSAPALHGRAVIFCCDRGYFPYALAAASQIAQLHPERDFDICLCSASDDLVLPASLQNHGFRICQVETDGMFAGLRLDAGKTDVVYLPLALSAAFAGVYERILYLDSDIFVQGGDFSALLGIGLGDHAIAAVRDNTQWRTPGRRPRQFRRLGLPTARYFNAGVMLIDVARYNADGILDACIALGRRQADKMIRHDQNLLNAVLQGRWAEVSPVWNWQYTWSSRLFEAVTGANIVHFIGPAKPWRHQGGEHPLRFRRAFRTFLQAHFPHADPLGPDGPAPIGNLPYLRKSLAKHLLATARMAQYLTRFPDDLTVYR